ncbi:hypothetical protein [Streptomyces sp. NPDC001508]|uniref:hypothetical protein n=1 Tax=Streptomyces sp. NPDC001508 TaxID=3154656 RepID=UPI003328A261
MTRRERPGRAAVRTAAAGRAVALAAVASFALAGCAVSGAEGRPSAGVPVSAPAAVADRLPTAPAEPTPSGTPVRVVPPQPATTAATTPPAMPPAPFPAHSTAAPKTESPPDLSGTAPASPTAHPDGTPAPPSPKPSPDTDSRDERSRDGSTTLRIGSWAAKVVRGGQGAVDACQDAVQWTGPDIGTEDGYALRTAVIVGHDYCGFSRFAQLPVGTTVTATTPRGTFTYRVYATYVSPGRGTPAHGLYWGDLTLQSCVGENTGFSYLARIRP